jgi:hypothetical protein
VGIALLTIGMGVNSSWAGSEQPSGLKFTPIKSLRTAQNPPQDNSCSCSQYHINCSACVFDTNNVCVCSRK